MRTPYFLSSTLDVMGLILLTVGISFLVAGSTGCSRPTTRVVVANKKAQAPVTSVDLVRGNASSETLFESLPAADCGIDFVPEWKPRNSAEALLLKTGFTGGGVAIGDYDNDGLADLFLTRSHGGGKLYRNRGDFQFQDVTESAGVSFPDDWHTGATFCDVNNDGALDLAVACFDSANRLFLNKGDGTYEDIAVASGVLAFPALRSKRYLATMTMMEISMPTSLRIGLSRNSQPKYATPGKKERME